MKKKIAALLVMTMALSLAGCGGSTASTASTAAESTAAESTAAESTAAESTAAESTAVESTAAESTAAESTAEKTSTVEFGDVMSYEEFMAADTDTLVTVETYIQNSQDWWEDETGGKASFYTQNEEGGYFLYSMPCTEEEYSMILQPGTKIKVAGYKAEWAGEIEITDAIFEVEEGQYIADPKDVTEFLGTEELASYMNQYVTFSELKVEAAGKDENGEDVAFLYNWDGSGQKGSDLYFCASKDGETYTFTVETSLTNSLTDYVYEAVENLKIGQEVDLTGFLYWYEGPNPHIVTMNVAEAIE